jgi:hypothetical protein
MFHENPFFFSITIAVAGLFVIAISDQVINLKSDSIEAKSKSWLPIASSEETLLISEIKSVEHYIRDPDALTYGLNIIRYVPGTTKRIDKLIIEFKDARDPYEINIGSLKEKEMLAEKLQVRIQALAKH